MKQAIIITLLSILISIPLQSQSYKHVDNKVKKYPKSFSKLEKLANQINKDFKKPDEKARAIYTWIALHVEYDTKGRLSNKQTSYSYRTQEEKLQKEKKIEKDLATQTLKKKIAVCQGYSTLFKQLCDLSSLECEIVVGTSKTRFKDIGKVPNDQTDHAWNVVKINGKWKLVDATWGAGLLDDNSGKFIKKYSDFYFLTDPYKFFLKHYPKEKKWLLIQKTAKEFAKQPLFYRDYFESNIKIIEPTSGVIKTKKNKTIKVILKNAKGKKVLIRFNNDRKPDNIVPTINGALSTYKVKVKATGYMTIYVDNVSYATFKIVR